MVKEKIKKEMDSLLDKAKAVLGDQFNEENWKFAKGKDKSKMEKIVEKLEKFKKIKDKGDK